MIKQNLLNKINQIKNLLLTIEPVVINTNVDLLSLQEKLNIDVTLEEIIDTLGYLDKYLEKVGK